MHRVTTEEPALADVAFLEQQLDQFNARTTGIHDARRIGVLVRDSSGQILAGVTGYTWGGTCFLGQVWVDESARRNGLGRQLMAEAEAEMRRRGCRQIVLTSHSFQAPGFYQKLGFEIVAEISDYPLGHSDFLLRKPLDAGPARSSRRDGMGARIPPLPEGERGRG
ncbi:MAG: GNAT family N-acetyltransferase [Gemmatimonadota bacterium]